VHPTNNEPVEVHIMLALQPRVVDAVFAAVEGHLPTLVDRHPLGCHRVRTSDRKCFFGILVRLVTGCSWDVAGRITETSESTLRRRRDEWVAAGVFEFLVEEAISGYDRIIGLELADLAVDGSQHKAPFGGEATGPSPVDRGKRGWKWSIATDSHGIPVAWVPAAANANDCTLFAPTLDALEARGLLGEVEVVHLDRGYDYDRVRDDCTLRRLDSVIPKVRPHGPKHTKLKKRQVVLGQRWPVERTNSWLSNFGQLRRNTDRFSIHRAAALDLAIALILTVKLMKWADRWNG
jgi:transposase